MDISTSSTELKLASQYALRVALQTMKERCMSLQQRLSAVEEENQLLRCRVEDDTNTTNGMRCPSSFVSSEKAETIKLKTQISELTRQKTQLSEHIAMVSNENRKLWSRLSKIDKDQNDSGITKENDYTIINETNLRLGATQNLIRSKTFTQHAPNPNLRHKIMPCDNDEKGIKDLSLEEVALENFQEDDNNIAELDDLDENTRTCQTNIGFAYLDVDGSIFDFNSEAKLCFDGLRDMHREVLKQQNDLNSALTVLESRKELRGCLDCEKKSKKPEMADKSLETDESITEMKIYRPVAVSGENFYKQQIKTYTEPNTVSRIDFLQEKIQADELKKADANEKMCPMCGKTYSSDVTFDAFREHVETHFLDDSDLELSGDRNFGIISHSVGDF